MRAPRPALLIAALAAAGVLAALLLWRSEPTTSPPAGELHATSNASTSRDPDEPAAVDRGDGPAHVDPTERTSTAAAATEPTEPIDAELALRGRVVDARGAPISAADVYVVPADRSEGIPLEHLDPAELAWSQRTHASTDELGRFRVPTVAAARLRLGVRARGHAPLERVLTSQANAPDLGDLVLEDSVVLRGRVLDRARSPIAGSELRRLAPDAAPAAILAGGGDVLATSDARGDFEVDELAPGPWLIAVHAEGHPPKLVRGVTANAGERVDGLEIVLEDGAELRGRVVGAPAGVAPGLWVAAVPLNLRNDARLYAGERVDEERFVVVPRGARCSADGAFAIRGLTPDVTYRVAARDGEHDFFGAARSTAVEARAGADAVELVYLPVTALELQVVDAESALPVTELDVRFGQQLLHAVAGADGKPASRFTEGRVRIEHGLELREGESLTLVIEARGYTPLRVDDVRPRRGETLDLGAVKLARAPTIAVQVLDDATGQPVAGANVRIEAFDAPAQHPSIDDRLLRAKTDAEGRARVNRPAGARVELHVEHADYAPLASDVGASDGGELEQTLRLRSGGRAAITVHDDAGRPVSGVRVLHDAPGAHGAAQPTRADGTLVLEHLAPGVHSFEVDLRRERTSEDAGSTMSITARDGETVNVRLAVGARARVLGRVTEAGRPLNGATLRFVALARGGGARLEAREPQSARSNAAGEFSLANVEAGAWTVRVVHPSRAVEDELSIDVRVPDTRVELDLPLATIEGIVLAADGRPSAGASVHVECTPDAACGGLRSTDVRADERGSFVLRGVPLERDLVVVARGAGDASARSATLRVARGQALAGIELDLVAR